MVNQMRYKYSFGMLGTAPPTRVKVAAGAMYNDLETGNNHQNDAILSKRVKGTRPSSTLFLVNLRRTLLG